MERLAADDLDRLEPLWLQLHHHHRAVAPELEPYVSDADSWRARRRLYEHVLAEGGFVLVARAGGADVGYLAAAEVAMPWTATLDSPARVTELVTMLVTPEVRGRGIGSALLDAFDAALEASGNPAALVGVVPQNRRAVALYERRGFTPAWLTMTRFGRPFSHPAIAHTIEPVAPAEVDALRPLWLELHHHHQLIAPQMAPFLDDDASWAAMRGILVADAEDGLAFRIGPAAAPVAMMTGSADRDSAIWEDTWFTAGRVAEPDVLVVAEGARGGGMGSALMDAYDDALAARGVTDQLLAAIAPNHDPIRLYQRRGFRPAFLEMMRFG